MITDIELCRTVVVLARTRYVIEELDRQGPPVRFHAVPLQPSPQPDAARANALRNDRDGDSDRKNGQVMDFMGVVGTMEGQRNQWQEGSARLPCAS